MPVFVYCANVYTAYKCMVYISKDIIRFNYAFARTCLLDRNTHGQIFIS